MANTSQFFSPSAADIELLYTDPVMVCFDNAGTKTTYLTREKYTWDSKTSTQVSLAVEYSLDGSTWSATVPTGTVSLGSCSVATTLYDKNEQLVNSGTTPVVLAGNTYHAISFIVLEGSATVDVNGVNFVAPQGYSQTWEADSLLAYDVTITATLATDKIIINTIN